GPAARLPDEVAVLAALHVAVLRAAGAPASLHRAGPGIHRLVHDHGRGDDVLQGNVHLLAFAGQIAGGKGRERSDRTAQTALVLGLHAAVLERLAVGHAADAHDAAHGVGDDLLRLVAAVGAGLTE